MIRHFHLLTSDARATSSHVITIPIVLALAPLFTFIPKVPPRAHLTTCTPIVPRLTRAVPRDATARAMLAAVTPVDTVFTIPPQRTWMLTHRTVVADWTGTREVWWVWFARTAVLAWVWVATEVLAAVTMVTSVTVARLTTPHRVGRSWIGREEGL